MPYFQICVCFWLYQFTYHFVTFIKWVFHVYLSSTSSTICLYLSCPSYPFYLLSISYPHLFLKQALQFFILSPLCLLTWIIFLFISYLSYPSYLLYLSYLFFNQWSWITFYPSIVYWLPGQADFLSLFRDFSFLC